jgi:tRNA threonylcarbamoyladenosine biosynthesis protein TsaE
MDTRITLTPEETETAGFSFAGGLAPGAVVGLYGELGTGKTCFVRGAARALNVRERVNSPTYSLVNVYDGDCPVYHMDAFRLKSPDEMVAIGFEDYVRAKGICFIEWAERIEPLLPPRTRRVRFKALEENKREITFQAGD